MRDNTVKAIDHSILLLQCNYPDTVHHNRYRIQYTIRSDTVYSTHRIQSTVQIGPVPYPGGDPMSRETECRSMYSLTAHDREEGEGERGWKESWEEREKERQSEVKTV